jgi:hypothetical protein
MKKAFFILIVFQLIILVSCSKDKSSEQLNINFQAKLNVEEVKLVDDKINYSDIMGYDTTNFTFLIDSIRMKQVRKYFFPSGGLPFSINVMNETIYSGKFFPTYSNSLPCGITIDPYNISNYLSVKIDTGYCNTGIHISDLRNDYRIISVLLKDKKIIKINL